MRRLCALCLLLLLLLLTVMVPMTMTMATPTQLLPLLSSVFTATLCAFRAERALQGDTRPRDRGRKAQGIYHDLSACIYHIITPGEPAPQSPSHAQKNQRRAMPSTCGGHEGQRAHLQALRQRQALAQLHRKVLRGRSSRQPAPKVTRVSMVVGGADAARRDKTRQSRRGNEGAYHTLNRLQQTPGNLFLRQVLLGDGEET